MARLIYGLLLSALVIALGPAALVLADDPQFGHTQRVVNVEGIATGSGEIAITLKGKNGVSAGEYKIEVGKGDDREDVVDKLKDAAAIAGYTHKKGESKEQDGVSRAQFIVKIDRGMGARFVVNVHNLVGGIQITQKDMTRGFPPAFTPTICSATSSDARCQARRI